MVRLLGLLMFISGTLTLSPLCSAQEVAATEVIQPMVLKFYDITPLVTPRQHHRFNVGSSAVTEIDTGLIGGGQGGFGGGGGQMGGGGGGFFSVPAEPVQMGQGGFGAGTPENAFLSGLVEEEPSLKTYLENIGGSSIGDLIQSAIPNESWESEDGSSLIHDLGNSLMIRQTEKVHAEIAGFLNELTSAVVGNRAYRLEVWWIPVESVDREKLAVIFSGELTNTDACYQLTTLQESKTGYHGVLICRERLTNHVASGNHVPVIAGSVPVVGQGTTGDQPIVRNLFLGLMLEARVQAVPDFSGGKGEVRRQQADVSYRTFVTSRNDNETDTANNGKIDRYSLAKDAAEGTSRIPVGRPVLVSSLSERVSQATSTAELQLIMLLTPVEE